jgi:hypothetical protein
MQAADPPRRAHATPDQLRADIDSGRTGDKVAAFDPALVPLGTDEEASGQSVPAEAVVAARASETRGPCEPPQRTGAAGVGHAWVLLAIICALAAGMIGWALGHG